MAVLAVIAFRLEPTLLLWLAGLAVVAFSIYYSGTMWYGHRHPGEALLEGSELLHWQQNEMAAKGLATIPLTVALPDPDQEQLPPSPPGVPQLPEPVDPVAGTEH